MTILEKIAAHRAEEIRALKEREPLADFMDELDGLPAPRFRAALAHTDRVNIIAEIKKGSPSKGLLRADLDLSWLARQYAEGGAAAISVLTEEKHFFGKFEYLEQARVESGLPVLCKDFVVDDYQIFYARYRGADAVLLIVALHTPKALARHLQVAARIGIDCLVEVHDEEELKPAIDSGAEIVGVNNRNLQDFSVSLETSERLAERMPANVIRVTESGVSSPDNIVRLRKSGYRNFLIGEALVTAPDPAELLRSLRGA